MATLDQQGNVLPDTVARASAEPVQELEEIQVTATRPNWPMYFLAAIFGVVLADLLDVKPSRRRR